ncbi:hypothetical protein EGR_07729 [Echinococcus granulosus]|uniref:Uncharacterized protein n=1 Tax=Echinococcus granulosus TaxID=6210 RepID=W6U8A6_ECHGR|nr:hypothetical protein EGR_07729 [Echinococcus granulosus]EUB57405.1 hypothetical protein EGR_07729 [Echinococcus granulosus]
MTPDDNCICLLIGLVDVVVVVRQEFDTAMSQQHSREEGVARLGGFLLIDNKFLSRRRYALLKRGVSTA